MQSSASSAARASATKLRGCTSVAKLVERLGEESVAAIFVDLQTPGLNLDELAEALDFEHAPKTVAFAQHVEEQLLSEADIPCIDKVLTRGQFSRELPNLITSVACQ